MKVVILAAGRGSRMKEWTDRMTKAMLPVKYENTIKPILGATVDNCIANGLKDFIFVVGYRREDIENYFGDGSNFGINCK